MRKLAVTAVIAIVALATAAVAFGGGDGTGPAESAKARKNIVKTAAGDPRFDTLVSLVKQAGLAKTLSGKGPFTVFAPTDKAFKKVPADTLEALGADKEALKRVLLYHGVSGRYPAARVVKKESLKSLAGPRLTVRVKGDTVRVGGAKVIDPDIKASNGIVHAINGVLIPPE
ncbi:MAG: fasciclin domain-containing protein [Thermoleophilaceae bacterium]|nr:fasciclin domain-containing protein [Thermoleophilaceae bacterium]